MTRRSPKQWTRPRSRAWREAHCVVNVAVATLSESLRILRRVYGTGGATAEIVKPAWAKTALKFGWITTREYCAVSWVKTGRMLPGLTEQDYKTFPMFGLKPKLADWGRPK